MNLSALKLAVVFAVAVVCFGLILTDVCLFGRRECFPSPTKLKNNLVVSLERLSFLENTATDREENVLDSPNGLNHHFWGNNCVRSIEALCNFPVFPKAPDRRQVIFRTELTAPKIPGVDGHRLLGYLLPNSSGEYHFAVVSNGFAEVWISPIKSWRAAKQVAYINPKDVQSTIKKWDFESLKSQISTRIHLKARKRYFIEIIYSPGARKAGENFLQVAWKRPGKSIFEIIEGKSLSPYTDDSEKERYKMFDDYLPDAQCCAKYRESYPNKYMKPSIYPSLENTAVNRSLDFCDYRPSYLIESDNFHELSDFKIYNGVKKHVHQTASFPYPNIDGVVRNQRIHSVFWAENPLEEQEAWSVVERYIEAIEQSYPGKYELESIIRVEKKEDPKKGERYFLELLVKDLTTGANYILSEYVFQPKGDNARLCYPKGLQWDRTADVYLILTAKNLGRWVHHFIKNVEQIVQDTKDEHLHVVIFDFDSPDIDLEQAFKRSTLKNYHFISQPGNYSRTVSLSRAVQSIQNPDAILVTVDLHLDIGSQLINDIRKHCSKGKTVYAPQIVFLNCGGSSALPRGVWYHYSYGTIAMYKADWDRFGGFSNRFVNKVTWGGEDWDIIDGAVKSGLEIERKRCPWVYHYYHTKAGMWSKGKR